MENDTKAQAARKDRIEGLRALTEFVACGVAHSPVEHAPEDVELAITHLGELWEEAART